MATGLSAAEVPASFYGRIGQGVFARGEQAGYVISVQQARGHFPGVGLNDQPDDSSSILGAIIAGVQDERTISMYAQCGYPVVVVDYWSRNSLVDCVVVDCFGEGERAAEFLLEQGHKHLFYLGNSHGPRGMYEHEADADMMLAGLQRALRRHDLSLPPENVFYCWHGSNDVPGIVRRVQALRPRPTAGVIFNAGTVEGFIAAMRECGLACPEDISLLCKAEVSDPIEAAALCADASLMGAWPSTCCWSGSRAVARFRPAWLCAAHCGGVRRFGRLPGFDGDVASKFVVRTKCCIDRMIGLETR